MDRRTILAVVLSLGIYYTWLIVRGPVESPPEEEAPTEAPVPVATTPTPAAPVPTDAPVRTVDFEGCGIASVVSTEGGGHRGAILEGVEGPLDVTPVYSWIMGLFSGGGTEWHPYGDEVPPEYLLSDAANAFVAGTGNPASSHRRFEIVEQGDSTLKLRSVGADGVEVEQIVSITDGSDPCTLAIDVTWTNRGTTALAPGAMWVGMFDAMKPAGGMFAFYDNTERAFARVDEDLEYGAWSDPGKGQLHTPEPLEGPTTWIGIADRYHGLFLLPEDQTGTTAWARYPVADGFQDGVIWSPPTSLAPGASHTASMRAYGGKHDTEVLAQVDETLVEIVDFGMFAIFCYPLLFALQFVEGFTGNWGLAIVILTVGVRLLFFPLNQSAFKSAEKMKVVQPLLNEIREKYKDDQEALNRETMNVFKEHKVNPLGGCLPMFIQMPVFLALFYVLMYSADLYHTEFLYLRDLSSPDPYCFLPSVVVVLMLLQQQFTPMGNMDPAQARMMKLMPLMFGVFWFMFPSGLVVYYFVNTALGILQQWWIRRNITGVATPSPAA